MPILDPTLPSQTHPYYQRRFRRWRKNRACYMGADDFYSQGNTYQLGPFTIRAATPGKTGYTFQPLIEANYLWRHEREKDVRYQRRLRMAAYENVFRPMVDTVSSTVGKACRKVEWPAGMEYLETNSDRWGQDAATFRARRISWAHVFGHVYTLLDKPEYESGAAPSRMHELAAGIRTYAQILTPLDLLDWNWDADAMCFRWALIRVARPFDREPPSQRDNIASDAVGSTLQQHTWTKLYEPGKVTLYRDGTIVEEKAGPEFVPICVQFAIGQDPAESEPVGIPINDDVTDLVELRFNKSSWLSDQEAAHAFNQAFIKTQGGEIDDELDMQLGIHTYIGADDFRWVAPDSAPMQHLMDSMARDQSEMRRMMGVETKGESSDAAKSGVALQLEQQNMSSLFASYAAAAECGEMCVWKMAAMLEGADPEAVKVQYVRDFSALDAMARFGTLMQAVSIPSGFTGAAKAELLKQIFMAAHPDIEPEKRDLIFAEIDAEAERAKAAAEAQRVQAQAVMDRLASGKPAEDEEGDEEPEDEEMPGKPKGTGAMAGMNGKGME